MRKRLPSGSSKSHSRPARPSSSIGMPNFPSLRETVWVGVSAESLVIAPIVGQEFDYGSPTTGGDRALGMSPDERPTTYV